MAEVEDKQKKDCYLIDQDRNYYGPFSIAQADERLQTAPFGWLLIRSGFCPVWSEDLEGLKMLLQSKVPSSAETSPPPLPPLPPPLFPARQRAAQPANPTQPKSRLEKFKSTSTQKRSNISNGLRSAEYSATPELAAQTPFELHSEFDVSCTLHFENQKRWFRQKQMQAKERESAASKAQKELLGVSRANQGAEVKDLELKAGATASKGMFSKSHDAHLKEMAGVWLFTRVSALPGAAKGLSVALCLFGFFTLSPFFSETSPDYIGFNSESKLNESELIGGAPSDDTTLRARGPAALKQLTRVVEAKLGGDFSAYTRELLALIPHHKIFQDDLIPSPRIVAALGLTFLSKKELENHDTWKPLLQLLGPDPTRGVPGVALTVKQIEMLVSRMTGVAFQSDQLSNRPHSEKGEKGEKGEIAEMGEVIEMARVRKLPGLTAQKGFGADPGSEKKPADLIYWGERRPGPGLASRMMNDAVDELIQGMRKIARQPGLTKSELGLRDFLVTRVQGTLAWFALGLGQPAMVKKMLPAFEELQRHTGSNDALIVRQLLVEATSDLSVFTLKLRLDARFALVRKMHQSSEFLCSPLATVLGLDFLTQTFRLAVMSGYPLPPLIQVYSNCFVAPSVLMPTLTNNFLGESEGLLSILPLGLNSTSDEWMVFSAILSDLMSRKQIDFKFNNQLQWFSLLTFSSPSIRMRQTLSQYLDGVCTEQLSGGYDAFCLVAKWNHPKNHIGFGAGSTAMRRELIQQIESKYGLETAKEIFFTWLLNTYLSKDARGKLPQDPVLLARKVELEQYLNLSRPHINSLDWLAKHGAHE